MFSIIKHVACMFSMFKYIIRSLLVATYNWVHWGIFTTQEHRLLVEGLHRRDWPDDMVVITGKDGLSYLLPGKELDGNPFEAKDATCTNDVEETELYDEKLHYFITNCEKCAVKSNVNYVSDRHNFDLVGNKKVV